MIQQYHFCMLLQMFLLLLTGTSMNLSIDKKTSSLSQWVYFFCYQPIHNLSSTCRFPSCQPFLVWLFHLDSKLFLVLDVLEIRRLNVPHSLSSLQCHCYISSACNLLLSQASSWMGLHALPLHFKNCVL